MALDRRPERPGDVSQVMNSISKVTHTTSKKGGTKMPERTSRITKAYAIPADIKPRATWGRNFTPDRGFAVKVHNKYWMSIFVDQRLAATDVKQRRMTLAKGGILGHCVSCVGENWDVHAEPVGEGKAGLIVYTAKGKAIAAGTATLDKSGTILFKVATLYRGITNAVKLEYKIEGKGNSDGSWSVTGSVTVSDQR
jgi:hypothetical protein